jgi:hypothetical protein
VSLALRVIRRLNPVDLSRDALDNIKTWGHACGKCADAAGSIDKVVVADVSADGQAEIDAPTWSRIKSDQAGLKWEVLDRLMDACGNELPLFWALHKRGYDPRSLRKYETDIERENRHLREQLAIAYRDREIIVEAFRGAKAA